MATKIYLKSKKETYSAEGLFVGGKVVVLKGSKIQLDFAPHIVGGKQSKKLRSDETVVDEAGQVLVDCSFNSPSTAAQFVTGRSTNGYEAWKVDNKTSLGKHLGRDKSR